MKIVYTDIDNFRVQLIRSKLLDAGIEAQVLNENVNNILPYSSVIPSMNMQVVVSDDYYDHAMEIIESSTLKSNLNVCPLCGGSNVRYGLEGKRKYLKIIAIILASLTLSGAGKKGNYHCSDCKQDF